MPKYNGADIPYFDVAFGLEGTLAAIPDAPASDGSMSYTQGFTTPYELPSTNPAYLPVPLAQTNQYLNDITTLLQYQGYGYAAPFITTAMNGGTSPFSYALGALCSYNSGSGLQNWVSVVAANTTVPGSSSNWQPLGQAQTRILLSGTTTYYVNGSTGNDSTGNGSSGAPWATPQHAINYIYQNVDSGAQSILIQLADGTYTGGITVSGPLPGSGMLSIVGDTATPASCIISTTSQNAVSVSNGGNINIAGFKLNTTTAGNALLAQNNSRITINGAMNFGAVASGNNHMAAANSSQIGCSSQTIVISGGGGSHIFADQTSVVTYSSNTVTLSGTPAFTAGFVAATSAAFVYCVGNSFSGSATGTYFNLTQSSSLFTNTNNLSLLPGNAAGSLGPTCTYDEYFGSLGSPIQVWNDETSSRALGTVYTNSTMLPITVIVSLSATTTDDRAEFFVNSVRVGYTSVNTAVNDSTMNTFIVPPGLTYEVTAIIGTPTITAWAELR